MAIYNGKCIYEVQFFVPEVPSKMYTIVDVESGNIVLQRDVLPTFPKVYIINHENSIREDPVSKMITDFNRNEKGNTMLPLNLFYIR